MRVTLTQSVVDTELKCPENRRKIEFSDSDGVKGLFIEARAGCSDHTYYVRYRDPHGTTRLVRLGRTSQISLADARREARKKKAEIILGADPAAERKAKKAIPLYSEFFEQRYLPFVSLRKRSFKRDQELYDLRIKAAIGNLRLNQITRERIVALHSAVRQEGLAASTANHHVRVIRYSLNLAVEWGLLEKNPASRIPLFHEDNVVNNLLDDAQLESLLTVLRTDRNKTVCRIALFLMSTGARLSEALSAKWADVDLERRSFTIRASNSKSRRLRAIPLSDTAMEVLLALPTRGEHEYLFVNSHTGRPYVTIAKQWDRIRKLAGVPFLRIHDLRHAFASFLVSNGVSLWTVSTLLGHSDPKISTRYAHLTTKALESAVNVASLKISGGDAFAGMSKEAQ